MRSLIGMTLLILAATAGNVYAAGTEVCPKIADIKSSPYTSDDPNIPPPFNEGFKYTAQANGKTWTGVTMATRDDYLAKKYELKAESYDGTSICSYGGKTITENEETAVPYLKLKSS